jgi:hypothetical protein
MKIDICERASTRGHSPASGDMWVLQVSAPRDTRRSSVARYEMVTFEPGVQVDSSVAPFGRHLTC